MLRSMGDLALVIRTRKRSALKSGQQKTLWKIMGMRASLVTQNCFFYFPVLGQ